MSEDAPLPPDKAEALDDAGRAIRGAQAPDRDEIRAAQRALRQAERAHDRAVRDARHALLAARRRDPAAVEAAEERLAAATADHEGVQSLGPLMRELTGIVEDDETVLDLASSVSAGHDGVVAVTSRRVLFLARRRTLALPLSEVRAVAVRGRFLGSRLTVSTATETAVLSGLRPWRARELGDLIRENAPAA